MAVRFHPHAQARIKERSATEDEVRATVTRGEQFPAKFGRMAFDVTLRLMGNGEERITGRSR
jgi:hypothetical protein